MIKDLAYDAFYRLTNVQKQIEAYIFDVIRSTIPRMDIDDLFKSKSVVAFSSLQSLQDAMEKFGHEIVDIFLTNVEPCPTVKAAMNEINASRRIKESMSYQAEAGEFIYLLCFPFLAKSVVMELIDA